MIADGLNLHTIELDEGEKIPNDLNKFDGMLCMGGPMDTFMEKEYSWLIEEKKKIKEFVIDLKKPYLGFCLGCQLLGEVVGGKVVKSSPAEIGMMDINFTNEKKKDNLFSQFPDMYLPEDDLFLPKKIKHKVPEDFPVSFGEQYVSVSIKIEASYLNIWVRKDLIPDKKKNKEVEP